MSYQNTIEELKLALPAKNWCENQEIITPFLTEWRDRWRGDSPFLLLPETTEQVARVVKICAKYKAPLSIQGGNTGLVGGQIPQKEILISTKRLDEIEKPDRKSHSLIVGAGAILQNVQEASKASGLKFPLSLASQGSCTIGGNIATMQSLL